jgi:Xaa-Pro aminopeptidase
MLSVRELHMPKLGLQWRWQMASEPVRAHRAALSAQTCFRVILLAMSIAVCTALAFTQEQLARQPLTEYRARRQKLLEQIKDGIIVLIGAREDDFGEVGRFRQKNNFMYLTGVETPAAFLLLIPADLIPGKPALEVLFIPPRNLLQERWTGVQIGPGPQAEQKFGIQEVANADKFYARLFDLLSNPPFKSDNPRLAPLAKVYTVVPTGPNAQLTREGLFVETIRRAAPHVQIVDVSPYLAEMRKIKSPAEVALIQKAVEVTAEGFRRGSAQIRPGAYEYEVQAAIEAAFIGSGAERPAYPSIIGSGFNSTILHYNQNRKQIQAGDLVVVDVGAEYSYYTADITRTYPASGKFTPRQREVYQLVLQAQRACEKAFKPGQTTMADLRRVAVEVMRASPLKDAQGNTLDKYFIHGLGHWLGMDVHDVGDYSKPIPVGAIITIEPGIYIPEENLGIRIEDDYLVTKEGLVKLSAGIPSEPDEVEQAVRQDHNSGQTNPTGRH